MVFETEMLKGYIDIILLSLLYREDLYGYELAKRVKEKTDAQFELKEGTLYLAFKRLEAAGMIASYWGEEGVGSRRKYYRLLPEGRRHIQRLKGEWAALREIINMFLEGVDTNV
ncbi:PadR family transcriptional regulator [Clostridia bacterium]|nr:PadR family transcriptional regulator [Clostridia bacterium]